MNLTITVPAAATELIEMLNRRETVVLTAVNGFSKPTSMGILSRLWHWTDVKFHEERLSKLASVVVKVISQQERLSIPEAAANSRLKAARILLKEAARYQVDLPNLRKEVTAAKLGITTNTLDKNPGLQKFTEDHHLERYLLIYQDALQVDPHTQQVSLRKEGQYQPWCTILEETRSWKQSTRTRQQAWVYGQEGIQNKDMYDWSELKPFMKGNPADWNHQYVFEICACFNPQSLKNGNHSWIRLKTPTGDIYSVGLYRPDKNDWTGNLKTPLRVKPGDLMQPDVSEFWDYAISTVDFAINEETFLKIKQTIEEDKKNEELIFQIFNNNCLLYNKKLARISGVDLPTLDNILFYTAPPKIVKTVARFIDKLPSFVQKISLYVAAFFVNIFQVFLGATILDDELNEKQRKKAVPHLNSFVDMFDINKMYLNHPNTLGSKTRQHVMKWRQQEIESINQIENDPFIREKKIKDIKFSLPPAYYKTFMV